MKKSFLPLVIGNWKMNPQSENLATRLSKEVKKLTARIEDVEIVLAPPYPYLGAVSQVQSGSKAFSLGAQNAHWEKLGAHTGEVSLPMLQSFGVTHVILGHSERRAAGETDAEVNKKIHATIKEGLKAVVCVGEIKRDHGGHYLGRIEEQIRAACAGLSKTKLDQLIIAYEPIWAIGTGDNATPEDVHEMKLFIEKVLSELYGRNAAQKVCILYGGSVNAKNAQMLMEHGMVNGFLVGGASLHAKEFVDIIKTTLN